MILRGRVPVPPKRWTFLTNHGSGWMQSSQRFTDAKEAAAAAAEWLSINAENGSFPRVHLGTVHE